MQKFSGTVRYIISPNCLLVAGPVNKDTGQPQTKYVTLQGIETPDYSLQDKEEPRQGPYGFQAREFLRKLVYGKKIEYTEEHRIKDDKIIGRVFLNNKDIGEAQLREGFAKLRAQGKHSQEYEDAQQQARSAKKGVWNEQGQGQILPMEKIDPKALKNGKLNNCLVEDVAGLFVFYAYVPDLKGLLKCSFGEILMPQVSATLQAEAKQKLLDLILYQQVTLTIQGYDEKFQSSRVDIFAGQQDIKLELLKLGYYRLANNAYALLNDQKRYNLLREAQSQAELKLIGIWKDAVKPNPQQVTQVGGKTVFQGKILEVHSGDQYTVMNTNTRESMRVWLASVKAPKAGKAPEAFGYEAREFARKHAIGRLCRVEVEYEKKVKPKEQDSDDERKKPQGDINMVFVNIILQEEKDQNLAALIIGAGFAQVQAPRGEDGFSRQMEELKEAQESAAQNKRGMHGKQNPMPKIVDLSINPSVQRSKDVFDSLKSFRKLSGVIELILNGSRMKVRFHEQNYSSIILLCGVRCLPNEQNMPDYQKFSNIALQYMKEHALQREVDIELESVDKKGVYHGHLILSKSKVNLGLQLLELGLAITFSPTRNPHAYEAVFRDAEQKAKLTGEGLWSVKNLDLSLVRGDEYPAANQEVKLLNKELKKWVLVEIADSNTLYFQDPSDKLLQQIEKSLASFGASEQNRLQAPYKRGLLCVAKFSVDGKWYRARVVRELKNRYEVVFLDYGNTDQVAPENIRKMPDNLVSLSYQAIRSHFAYCICPSADHAMSNKVGTFIGQQIFEKEVVVQLEYQADNSKGVIVFLTKENDVGKSLNKLLLDQGYAKLDRTVLSLMIGQAPQCSYQEFKQAAQAAEENAKGMWQYNDDDEDQ